MEKLGEGVFHTGPQNSPQLEVSTKNTREPSHMVSTPQMQVPHQCTYWPTSGASGGLGTAARAQIGIAFSPIVKQEYRFPREKCSLCVIRLKKKLASHEIAGTIKPPLYKNPCRPPQCVPSRGARRHTAHMKGWPQPVIF